MSGTGRRATAARLQAGTARPVLLALVIALVLATIAAVVAVAALSPWWPRPAPPAPEWLPTFIAPLHPPITGDPLQDTQALKVENVTLRQFLPLALPGQTLRVRLSNEFGEHPLQVDAAGLAWREGRRGASIVAPSARPLLFAGSGSVRIPAGATALSEPVSLPSGADADLALSLYLPQSTPRASWNPVGSRSSFRSRPGNHVDAAELPVASVGRDIRFVASVEVETVPGAALWVAFGDSITAGAWHRLDADASWPAAWGEAWRARARPGRTPAGVLNVGVAGDRLLEPVHGPSGIARFERDVLAPRGVHGAVLAIGINDLGAGAPELSRAVQVERLIAAQTALAARARARGLKVVGATLTPAGGSAYGRPEFEAARQRFNDWVRTGSVFDAVVDFDAAVRDPQQPGRMRAQWTTDWLHPDDAGYQAMADALVDTLDRAGLAPK